jgi:HNH endonuclease
MRSAYPCTPTSRLAVALNRTVAATYNRAATLGLTKSDAFRASPASGRTTGRQGMGTRFEKGHAPANKGLRRPGWAPGRMRETQFRKGERRGVAVKLWKPVGTERISADGYLERKINDGLPLQRRWRAVHLLVWEAAHGPVPRGHAIAFKNGDKRDIRPDNLECIARSALMGRNTVHNLPKPVAQAVQLLGALNRQIRKRQRASEKQD